MKLYPAVGTGGGGQSSRDIKRPVQWSMEIIVQILLHYRTGVTSTGIGKY